MMPSSRLNRFQKRPSSLPRRRRRTGVAALRVSDCTTSATLPLTALAGSVSLAEERASPRTLALQASSDTAPADASMVRYRGFSPDANAATAPVLASSSEGVRVRQFWIPSAVWLGLLGAAPSAKAELATQH